jgi:hypothetical protein
VSGLEPDQQMHVIGYAANRLRNSVESWNGSANVLMKPFDPVVDDPWLSIFIQPGWTFLLLAQKQNPSAETSSPPGFH